MARDKFAVARALVALAAAVLVSACANGPCRHLREPQLAEGQAAAAARAQAQQQMSPSSANAAAGSGANASGSNAANGGTGSIGGLMTSSDKATISVYKADGSLQCASAKGLSLEEMEKQLHGIPVLSRDKRPDGRMHIQVCGSPTGIINVFEIPETSFKDAELRGFKKL